MVRCRYGKIGGYLGMGRLIARAKESCLGTRCVGQSFSQSISCVLDRAHHDTLSKWYASTIASSPPIVVNVGCFTDGRGQSERSSMEKRVWLKGWEGPGLAFHQVQALMSVDAQRICFCVAPARVESGRTPKVDGICGVLHPPILLVDCIMSIRADPSGVCATDEGFDSQMTLFHLDRDRLKTCSILTDSFIYGVHVTLTDCFSAHGGLLDAIGVYGVGFKCQVVRVGGRSGCDRSTGH